MSTMGGIAMYKKIDSDIMKFARAFGKAIVARATVEINEYAIKALYDSYYSQYNPTYYQRTEQMLFNSYERFMVTSDTRCEGGIRIKNKGVFYNLGGRNITTEEIIDNVWMRGSHGWRISYYKPLPRSQMSRKKEKDLFFKNWTNEKHWQEIITTPTPYDYLCNIVYSDKYKNSLIEYGLAIAKSQRYTYLNFG